MSLTRVILKYIFRLIWIPTELFFAIFFVLFSYVLWNAQISGPDVPDVTVPKRVKVAENHYRIGNNFLRKNEYGIWEMYLEGEPYERGLIYGELAKELVQEQETIFVGQIEQFLPNKLWRHVIKLMVGFFNSDLPDNIPLENQQEIFGISRSFSDQYNYIASKYTRILNYHAAHDIGHALNDYSMVGCTSFAVNGERSQDGSLLIGRNFDFSVGDDFAKNKLVIFLKPSEGYAFSSISWAGFTGVASGMNEKGLTVTINAAKSDLPTGSKMPISLLAREILQYASTTEEAIAIARKRHTFVSETLLVGSAAEKKAILIEKSPSKLGVKEMNQHELVCSNHYQSKTFREDPNNIKNIAESDSKGRYERMMQLLSEQKTISTKNAVQILRNQNGWNNDTLGMGNPLAINQLLAHHSVVMKPEQRMFYVSTTPYQLGSYLGYNLEQIFKTKQIVVSDSVQASPFIQTKAFREFNYFKSVKQQIIQQSLFGKPLHLSDKQIKRFVASNSELYLTYEYLGDYYRNRHELTQARKYYNLSLTKKTASKRTREEINAKIAALKNN